MSNQNQHPNLDTLDAIALYLADAFDHGEADHVTRALAAVAGAKGMPEFAAAAGIPRQQLTESFLSGELTLDVTLAIMKVIDLHIPSRPHGGR